MVMANHCLICYKGLNIPARRKQNENDNCSKSREKCEMFFKLLERYLKKDPGDEYFQPFPVWENIFDAGIPISCEACQGVMASFCELFHQMKSIELLINWKLWTLKNIMYSAERVPSRLKDFKEAIMQMQVGKGSGGDGDDEPLNLILSFKRHLIKNCRRKLLTTFPRLKLVKFQEKVDQSVQTSATEVEVDSSRKEMNNASRIQRVALTEKRKRKEKATSKIQSTLRKPLAITIRNESEADFHNAEEQELNFNDFVPETPERCADAKIELNGIERSSIPTTEDPLTAGEPGRNIRHGPMDDSTTENIIPNINVDVLQATEPSIIISTPTQCPSRPASRNLIYEEELPQAITLTLKHVKIETISNNSSEPVLEHQGSHEYEDYLEFQSIGDDEKASEIVNSESYFICSADQDLEDASNSVAEGNLISTNRRPFSNPGDILLTDSESDDSEADYYNENEMNGEEKFNVDEGGESVDPQPSKRSLEPNSETVRSCQVQKNIKTDLTRRKGAKSKGKPEAMDDSATENTLLKQNQAPLVIPSSSAGFSPASLRTSITEEDSYQANTFTSKYVQSEEATPKNCSYPEVVTTTGFTPPTNFDEGQGPSCSGVTASNNTRDVTPTTQPGTELEKSPTEAQEPKESSISKLRSVHRCVKCKKTFSFVDRLREHEKEHGKETYSGSYSKSDEDSSSEIENSESDLKNDNLISTKVPQLSAKSSDILPNGSESGDSDSEYYNENEINVGKEDFDEGEHVGDLELKSYQCTPTVEPNSQTVVDDHSQIGADHSEGHGNCEVNEDSQLSRKAECSSDDKGAKPESNHIKLNQTTRKRRTCNICKSTLHTDSMKPHYNACHNLKNLTDSDPKTCTEAGCTAYFLSSMQLRRHERNIHGIDKLYTCDIGCKAPTAKKRRPRQVIFQCKVASCTEKLPNKRKYDIHQKLHGKFTCFFCSLTKDYALELAKHEIREHSQFSENAKYSDGKELKNGSKLFSCPRPNCSFGSKIEKTYIHHFVSDHMELKPNARMRATQTCPVCKSILRQGDMKRHYNTLHNLKNLNGLDSDAKKCVQTGCAAYFLSSEQLRKHEREVHGIDKRSTTCTECNKTLYSNSGLNYHYHRMHKYELNYICSFENCDKRYTTNELLEGHIKAIHDQNLQLLRCPTCERKCWGEANLKSHLKLHSSIRKPRRKYICEHCGKVFKDKEVLKIHYLSHSGPDSWEFECSVCSKKCISQHKLDEHMRTHTKEKPFVCEICGVKYAHRHNLRIHVNSKHGDMVQDIPKKYTKINLTSRKGIKRKKVEEETSESSCNSESDDD